MKKLAALFTSLCIVPTIAPAVATAEPPRLVLQITVDGLRADMLPRYRENFVADGFNYLLNNGAVYTNAHYLHANTETIVGHATLATGATPAVHGMVGNVWYNGDTGELGYNIEDPAAPILPTRDVIKAGAQIDPAQKRSGAAGRSPRSILVPTFSDTLAISSEGQARVFGISGKDRSAVAMAGKTGTAYWYSTDTGDFQTSAYYMDQYPQWVSDWNQQRKAERLAGTEWQLLLERDRYRPGRIDDRPYEVDLKGYGRVFPHAYGDPEHPLFFTRVMVSPAGDDLLLDFGKQLIEAEDIGADTITDYLSISFSGVDAVNHFFGPASIENEDVVLRLDRTLAELFDFIDERIGLDQTLIVLSADHGMAEMPEFASEMGYATQRIYGDQLLAIARKHADELYGTEDIVRDFFRPYFYLDADLLRKKKLDRNTVASKLAARLSQEDGIGSAIAGNTIDTAIKGTGTAAILHNQHPQRSGDIYIYQAPYGFILERGAVAAMHGSPWRYDSHVPIIFAGAGIGSDTVNRRVHPIDVAPTLSAFMQLVSPAGAKGSILPEVIPPRP